MENILKYGLYDPTYEHDACGVGFIVNINGDKSHSIVDRALKILENLEHRGAKGAEPDTGDGAGILLQIPRQYLRTKFKQINVQLPDNYAIGQLFFNEKLSDLTFSEFEEQVRTVAKELNISYLGSRVVPVDDATIGNSAKKAMPVFYQLGFGYDLSIEETKDCADSFERVCFILRKVLEHRFKGIYFSSLSHKVLVYKGMLTAIQLRDFYVDLKDPDVVSAIGLVHSRFSTNTFPSWQLAHPYRYIAHNGEINTLQGNRNWMKAREALLKSELFNGNLDKIFPTITEGASDSASFDEVLELLYMGGRTLAHSVLMMIPEAWENHELMDDKKRAFYEFHASLMEAWDGPASVTFTDGVRIGAVLDRNGLRPSRFWVTESNEVIMASEVGVLDIDQSTIVAKGRLSPGKMFLVDTSLGKIVDDSEIKAALANQLPYRDWLKKGLVRIEDLPVRTPLFAQRSSLITEQRVFGYTEEELRIILTPMAKTGVEPIGSMGSDSAIAAISDRPRLLFDYFSQLFAQVTNPPLDAIREELVTSLRTVIGPEHNLFEPSAISTEKIVLPRPVITEAELAKLSYIDEDDYNLGFKAYTLDGVFKTNSSVDGVSNVDANSNENSIKVALDDLCKVADEKIAHGANILVLSNRVFDENYAPIPSLLLTGAIHHHLVKNKLRSKVALVVEAGDAREVHHIALLIGYGASAVCPYLAISSVQDLIKTGQITQLTQKQAEKNLIKSYSKGVLKIMSKMGISTVSSYCGAQIFEAVGIGKELIEYAFCNTSSKLDGIGFGELTRDILINHSYAFENRQGELAHRRIQIGGEYQWRREGEYHLFNPKTVFKLQHSTKSKSYQIFKEYTKAVDDQAEKLATLRGLLKFKVEDIKPIDISEVEPVSEIVKRFSTGAMSYGSISKEAHETLAIAMNRLKARSNTGEGGEDSERFTPDQNGDHRRSAIKQVASGRFGVTSEYLVNADDIQIKMAQGAKPGEGGQLPGHKVYPWIAKTRKSTPGVGLISPPPHHDIYSIEDLAQLIPDLKNANNQARIHVKLVSEVGVGTVAAGVSKAHADVVLISGHDGGTGASPLTSLKHAGTPWEIGLAETQQTLVMNGLRDRIVVQVDGQMKTGKDVVVAALLGAEEFGFATAPLVVSGCIMMRVCHLDTCPVGIATQNPELRSRFSGKAEFVVNFFEFIGQEVREILASLGLRSLEEAIGKVELLDCNTAIDHFKAKNLDFSAVLKVPVGFHDEKPQLRCTTKQDHGLEKALDNKIIEDAKDAIENEQPISLSYQISNRNRTVGTMLGAVVSRKYQGAGLKEDTLTVRFTGSAGQSFGAFLPKGITLKLYGDANDYVGKGLSGGKIIVRPPKDYKFIPSENIIAGNVILYGATGGSMFLSGQVGERFAVRNSGAVAVVEGVGDHCCEYMTGGKIVVLGKTGRNFGAGMSGGIGYVYDFTGDFVKRLNMEMVSVESMEEEDVEFLRNIIQEHYKYTDSEVAAKIISSYESEFYYFKKVMPKDYRRVLDVTREAIERGEDIDEAIMAAAHG